MVLYGRMPVSTNPPSNGDWTTRVKVRRVRAHRARAIRSRGLLVAVGLLLAIAGFVILFLWALLFLAPWLILIGLTVAAVGWIKGWLSRRGRRGGRGPLDRTG